ncbi:MAG: GNAT family N-acetyltransferase, partial [Ignavibacteriaceae bacterium]
MKTTIRKCTLNDLKTLLEISYETFVDAFQSMNEKETMDKYVEEAFNIEKLEEELRNKDSRFFFLYADNKLAGYLKINEAPVQTDINDPDSIEVERIYIKKEFKGKGLGRQIINYAIQLAKEM